jgi:phage-related minor tail protein
MADLALVFDIIGRDKASNELNKVGGAVDDAGGKVGGFGEKIGKLGPILGGLGAVAAAAFAGISQAMENEMSSDKLAAQLGATGAWAEELGSIAGNLYANAYGESLGQVNEALRAVMQNGVVMEDATQEEIEATTGLVLDLASAFDQDLSAATNAVGQMIRTGLADNATEAMDILTRGFQQGADASGDLLDTFVEYPALFERLGLDGQTAMGLIEQGMAGGARNADLVADALKEFQIRATDGSKTSADAFAALGLSARDMTAQIAGGGAGAAAGLDTVLDRLRDIEDPVARNAAAVGIFGTQAEDLGDALFSMDPSEAVGALGEVAGAAENMSTTLADNAGTRLEAFKRQALGGIVDFLGGQLLPALDEAGIWIRSNFGPAFDAAKAAIQPFIEAFTSGGDSVGGSIGRIRESVQGVVDYLGPAFETAKEIFQSAVDIVTALWDRFGANIVNYFSTSLDNLLQIARGVLDMIKGVFDVFAGILTGDWGRVWDGIKGIFSGAWGAITGLFQQGWNTLTTIARNIGAALSGIFSGLWNGITSGVSSMAGSVRDGFNAVVDFARSLPGRIGGAIGNFGSLLYNAGKDMINGLLNGAGSLLRNIGRFFLDMVPGWIRGPFESALGIASPSKVFAGYGMNIGQGLIAGMAGMEPAVASQMRALADTQALGSLTGSGLGSPVLAGVTGYGATPGGGGGAVVHIDRFEAAGQSPDQIAESLAWLARTR